MVWYGEMDLLKPLILCTALLAAGCSAMPRVGPSANDINNAGSNVVAVSEYVLAEISQPTLQVLAQHRTSSLSRIFSKPRGNTEQRVAVGDVMNVQIYEASSGGLFTQGDAGVAAGSVSSMLPPQTVDQAGRIAVPFVGPIKVASLSVRDIEKLIQKQLAPKAIDPQVIVSVMDKRGTAVTVGGDVQKSGRVPLQTGSERLLDIISVSGGTVAPAYKSHVKLTRGSVSETMLLSDIVNNPKENVYLAAGDSIFVNKIPQSYVILGATRGAEVPFGLERLSLAQAVGRAGGLDDMRADPAGVYVFRYEEASIANRLDPAASAKFAGQRRIPVVYRANLRDPRALFDIQAFEVRNGDLLYVANANSAQLQKFLALVGTGMGIVRSADYMTKLFDGR